MKEKIRKNKRILKDEPESFIEGMIKREMQKHLGPFLIMERQRLFLEKVLDSLIEGDEMKNKIINILLLCAITAGASGQTYFGIKGGLGLSSYYGSDWEDSLDSKGINNQVAPLTAGGGIFGILELNDFLAVQSEVLFISQSVQYGEGSNYTRIHYTAVDIPFYVKGIFWRRDDGSRFYVAGGPEYKTILGHVKKEESAKDTKNIPVDEFLDHTTLWGAAVGFGYEMEKDYGIWTFGIKYSRGITDLWDGSHTHFQKVMLEAGFGLKG